MIRITTSVGQKIRSIKIIRIDVCTRRERGSVVWFRMQVNGLMLKAKETSRLLARVDIEIERDKNKLKRKLLSLYAIMVVIIKFGNLKISFNWRFSWKFWDRDRFFLLRIQKLKDLVHINKIVIKIIFTFVSILKFIISKRKIKISIVDYIIYLSN